MTTIHKAFGAQAEELGPREVRVQCSSASVDRDGEVIVQGGISYPASVPVLWAHDQKTPALGRAYPEIINGNLFARVVFEPEGIDDLADKICAKVKAGTISTVSIGFDPIDFEPMAAAQPRGPQQFKRVELLELSFCNVPANQDATVVQRMLEEKSMPKAKAAAPLKVKGLYTVANLAYLLADLGYIEESAEWEAEYEGDDSPVPAMLADAMRQLGETLIAMTAEEVGELLAEEAGEDKACAVAKLKSFRSIIKAGRALSSANEGDIKAAVELIGGTSDKLTGVLAQVEQSGDAKALEMEHFRCKVALAGLSRSAA